jgi:hypothetical protein
MQQKDTKSKPVPDTATRMHHRLASGEAVDTGAGKGALGGKNPPKTKP